MTENLPSMPKKHVPLPDQKPWKTRSLERVLRVMARSVVRKYRPRVVGVTGSIGKTSAKEAIVLVLSAKYSVRGSEENYNNEIGLPLTVIGSRSGKRSLSGWLAVILRWAGLMLFPCRYPEVLVLEMGVDRPGDMKYLLDLVPVEVGVLTHISGSHLEYFGTLEAIAKEKGLLLRRLTKNGTAVVNADNEQALRAARKLKAPVLTYGFSPKADIRAEYVGYSDGRQGGLHFRLNYSGRMIPVRLPNVVARHHVLAVLSAVGVGLAFRMNLVDIAVSLEKFASLPGRMRLFEGLRGSAVIDDTYNASPSSLRAALETAQEMSAARRIAVLGDMLELGEESESAHARVAEWLRESGFLQAVLVGPRMLAAAEALRQAGWSEDAVRWFGDPVSAGEYAASLVGEGDLVLAKGSQGMRMEKAVEAVLADPTRDRELLCRQSPDWRRKPFVQPS